MDVLRIQIYQVFRYVQIMYLKRPKTSMWIMIIMDVINIYDMLSTFSRFATFHQATELFDGLRPGKSKVMQTYIYIYIYIYIYMQIASSNSQNCWAMLVNFSVAREFHHANWWSYIIFPFISNIPTYPHALWFEHLPIPWIPVRHGWKFQQDFHDFPSNLHYDFGNVPLKPRKSSFLSSVFFVEITLQ